MNEPHSYPLEIDVHEVAALRESEEAFLLLDCREPMELQLVQLEGARHIPMGQIPQHIDELAAYQQQRLVVFCHHGGRSLQVCQWLRQQGFPGAQNMTGGIDAWSCEIDPTKPRY